MEKNYNDNEYSKLNNLNIEYLKNILNSLISIYNEIHEILLIAPADILFKKNINLFKNNKFFTDTINLINSKYIQHLYLKYLLSNNCSNLIQDYITFIINYDFTKNNHLNKNRFVINSILLKTIYNQSKLFSKYNSNILNKNNINKELCLKYKKKTKKNYETNILNNFVKHNLLINKTNFLVELGCGKSYMTIKMLELNMSLVYLGLDRKIFDENIFNLKMKNNIKKSVNSQNKTLQNSIKDRINLFKVDIATQNYNVIYNHINTIANRYKVKEFTILGLHSCGDLTSEGIKLFKNCNNAKSLIIIGCCLHLISEYIPDNVYNSNFFKEYYKSLGNNIKGRLLDETLIFENNANIIDSSKNYGFPISKLIFNEFTIKLNLFLGRTVRKLSMQFYENYICKEEISKYISISTIINDCYNQNFKCLLINFYLNNNKYLFFRKAFIRCCFQNILELYSPNIKNYYGFGEIIVNNNLELNNNIIELLSNDIINYLSYLVKNFNLNLNTNLTTNRNCQYFNIIKTITQELNKLQLNINKNIIIDYCKLNIEYFSYMLAHYLIRYKFARIIELIVTIDRLSYILEDNNFNVQLFEIFDFNKSKRNLLICSNKI